MKQATAFKLGTKGQTYYYVSDEHMFVGTPHAWEKDTGTGGDNLWRTGWAYIVYKHPTLLDGILRCFTEEIDAKGKIYIQAHRSPGLGADDVSRDQITGAICALSINQNTNELKTIVKGLKWRISKKFRLSLDMWFWMQSLVLPKPFNYVLSFLFHFSSLFSSFLGVLWDIALYKWAGVKEISQEEYNTDLHAGPLINSKDDKKADIAFTIHYPFYALHLFAWQLHSSPYTPIKPLLQWLCRIGVHRSNYFMRLIFNGKVKREDIEAYRPMSGVRWQGRFFKKFYSACEIIEENSYFSKKLGLTSQYNALDNDMLWYMAILKHKLVI